MNQNSIIVLGTANRKKGEELRDLFRPLGVEIQTLADYPAVPPVEENGSTFAANAALKASGYARQLGRWVLADDSGLIVDALGDEPGVYSARYAGPEASDADNNRLLLTKLADLPPDRRTARFVCSMALADPQGALQAESEETCRGQILYEPRGSGGFGYDPLFEIPEYHRTFAELGTHVKAYLSHRSRAAWRMLSRLPDAVFKSR
ncbi:MAG: RdgB/HAM1 family non-canonical purine NTP pyrophosphatase [Pirellulales bacterium]|nr:RdgB/HAM1 family non-canonical purine NTP pyrophosphatase [Pirellulales bacterium]